MSEAATQIPPATGWQTFGHDAAKQMLDAANMSGRLSHAYLITGPAQVGRRTLAIDLACLVNCEPQPDLFGEAPVLDLASCPGAQRIRKGQHADVRIIDTATPLKNEGSGGDGDDSAGAARQQISINHIHDLQHDAALKPFEGRSRVFILDGAESLSPPAANALLKTLEEPSEDVFIVLVSSDADALPETITSRCQRISLRRVPSELIAQQLVDKFDAEPEHAGRLAKLSAGKPGWAISAMRDPAVLEIYTQTASRILHTLCGDLEQRFIYARELSGRFRRDRTGVLSELDRWLEWWRDVGVARAGLVEQVINANWVAAISEIAHQLGESDIVQGAGAVSTAVAALEANAIPQLAIEVLMLEMPAVSLPESSLTAAPETAPY